MRYVPRRAPYRLLVCVLSIALAGPVLLRAAERSLAVATFEVDATPPVGSPLCDALVAPAEKIVDPLSARGIVLLTEAKPIVLCVVDWVGIGNGGQDAWRAALAAAAHTTTDRVAVHAIHQHDAPGCDFTAEGLLAERGLSGKLFHVVFARETIRRVAEAVRESVQSPRSITHVGVGRGKVEKVASNRRILGDDGKVKYVRYSSCRDENIRAQPEGVIDPYVALLSFWDGEQPVASLTYYATHPQSYYGRGGVSADFVGMARAAREKALPKTAHIHFNGAGGNLAAGKYNDGAPDKRPLLAGRLAEGIRAAWEVARQHRKPIDASDVQWRTVRAALPVRDILDENRLVSILDDPQAALRSRLRAARELAWVRRCAAGHHVTIGCLRLGESYVLHMPGELFVEYQLAAQKMRPGALVFMAAYGDYGPGYIGTEISYTQGGYETGPVSRTAPQVEGVLMEAMRKLLK